MHWGRRCRWHWCAGMYPTEPLSHTYQQLPHQARPGQAPHWYSELAHLTSFVVTAGLGTCTYKPTQTKQDDHAFHHMHMHVHDIVHIHVGHLHVHVRTCTYTALTTYSIRNLRFRSNIHCTCMYIPVGRPAIHA